MNNKTQQITSLEAYVRWHHPEHGNIPPSTFIPVAEQFRFIQKLDLWMYHYILKTIQSWQHNDISGLSVAFNPSLKTLLMPNLAKKLSESIAQYKIDPALIEIDLKDKYLNENHPQLFRHIQELKSVGFRIAIDGLTLDQQSQIEHLKIEIDTLKLHHHFMQGHPDAESEMRAFIQQGFDHHLSVVAEGIETKSNLDIAEYYGCYLMQGYYFSRPIPGDDILVYLKENG